MTRSCISFLSALTVIALSTGAHADDLQSLTQKASKSVQKAADETKAAANQAADQASDAAKAASNNAAKSAEKAKKTAKGALPKKQTTQDGLVIEDIVVGKGKEAKAGNDVTVDYTGKLTNGTQFDSSIGREPFKFKLGAGQVIKGWDEGVAGMREGGKRKLTIPASLGYGDHGAGGVIPPGATLVFDVDMKKVD